MQNLLTFIRTELWLAHQVSLQTKWHEQQVLSFCVMLLESGDLPWKHLLIHMINTTYTNAFNHLEISFFKKSSVNVSLCIQSIVYHGKYESALSVSTNRKVWESTSISFFLCMKHKHHATCHLIYDMIINSK